LRATRFCADRYESSVRQVQQERLTVKRTATGYWVVQRGSVQLAGSVTRAGAEAERELLERLRDRDHRRSHTPRAQLRR
jgi:hypothetical protein